VSDIAVLEKIVILCVFEDADLYYDMIEDAYLLRPGYAIYALEGTVYLGKVERIYQTGLKKFYILDNDTSSVKLAADIKRDPAVIIPEIVAKLQGRDVLDWLTRDVLTLMAGDYEFQVIR
jgi:hypothetical protein